MGILAPGSVSATIGTSGVVFAATAAPTRDRLGRLHTFCHAVPGRWHVMGVTQAAGLSLRWLRDTVAPGEEYGVLTAEAAQVPAGSDGLLWTPYLLGERTPHLDSTARAAFVGLTAGHTRGHLVRAVLEGVAYSLKDTFTLFSELGIPVKGVRLGGGGARGALWREIQASVYGYTTDVLAAEEGGAFGAALLAGVGAGVWPDLEAACGEAITVAQQIEPDAKLAERYAKGYEAYRKVYPALRGIVG
jgi:xylulokinase